MPQSVGPVPLARFKCAVPYTLPFFCNIVGAEKTPQENIRRKLLENVDDKGIPLEDPIPVLPRFLDKLFKDIEPHIPHSDIYTCIIYNNGEVGFKGEPGPETRFISAPDIPIDFEYLEHTADHPLIVDLTGALLTVYDPELKAGKPILPEHFMQTPRIGL